MNPARQRVATRRLYAWERQVVHKEPHLNASLSIVQLRIVAMRVWQAECGGKVMPHIVAGRGILFCGRWMSLYCSDPAPHIVLARNQRNLGVLLHELAHALVGNRGYDHGPAFVECYLRLLEKHGGWK